MSSKKRFKSFKSNNIDEEIKLTPDRKSESQYINWFPGHMNKAIKQIKSKLKLVDIILEIRDARVPEISKNMALDEAISGKLRIILFNKNNLADPITTQKWKIFYEKSKEKYIFTNALDKNSIDHILEETKKYIEENYQIENPEGQRNKKITMMIIGLPNTGKSTFINRLSGRNAARTANKPGYTQSQQWIKIDQNIELLDTPGIMPPKINSMEDGLKLCAIFAIPSKIVPDETTACFLLKFLTENYPFLIEQRYGFSPIGMDFLESLDEIGTRRNCILKKAEIDYEKVYKIILTDFRDGRLGKVSLESPKP